MILDPLDIPDELLEAQEQGELVVFVGSGLSRGSPSELPDFKGLAAHVAKGTRFENQLQNFEKNIDRFFGEMVRGDVDIQHLVRERIGNPASQSTDLHRWIIDLFPETKDIRVVTTNFDSHFSSVLSERDLKCDHYFAPALPLGRNFRGIVYLHGSLLRTDDPLVLSDEDFGRAYMIEGWAREFLRGLFDTYTTLFIGYSHSDPPVEYLARGMSAMRVAPRFALVSKSEENWWNSLKVKPITFEKPAGDADFSELGKGLRAWAQFSKDQPTDIAQKVRDILRSPPEMKPAKSQSSLLVRCLKRKDECHFFTNEAVGWHWVEWAHEQGLLKSLFTNTLDAPSELRWQLAFWLAKMLITEQSEKGLLLVAENGGAIGRDLWLCLCQKLWVEGSLDFRKPILQKWLLLLLGSYPEKQKGELGHLLQKVAQVAPKTLGLALFRFLTNLRVTVHSGFEIDPDVSTNTFRTRPRPEFDLTLVGDAYQLEQVWETVFKPLIPQLGRDYLRILEDRLREMYGLLRAAGRADDLYDPWSMRGDIRERDVYRSNQEASLVVDCLLDVVEIMAQTPGALAADLIGSWLSADCPTLLRIGLLGLLLSRDQSGKQKVHLLINRQMIYPEAFGSTHETYTILQSGYPELSEPEKLELWNAIDAGPKYPKGGDINPDEWTKYHNRQIDKLTAWLATRNKECPFAKDALRKLKERSPDIREHAVTDKAISTSGVIDMAQSPKSAADLLSQKVDSQIDFLLTYRGEPFPSGITRTGLVAVVGDACAQNPQWAISLFEELANRENWESDLWEGAFWRLRLTVLPAEKLAWLLDVFDEHFANSPSLQGLTFFLFNGVEFTEQKAPPKETLEALVRISLHIWNQLRLAEPSKTADFEKTEWTNHAINQPAGRIVEFWLKCWGFLRQRLPAVSDGWPEWLLSPLEDIVKGESYAAQLGRVMLGNHIPFVHAIDPVWARARLFPKFNFTQVGNEAFLLWEPHLKYGQLSRDLVIEMLPLYRQAFPYFRNVKNDLAIGLYRHVAVIIYSCLIDVNQDGWLKDFLLSLTDQQLTSWANQMEFILRNFPNERKKVIWDKWMHDYWQGRLHGKPCKLKNEEAGEMLECALVMEPVFSQAVELVIHGPTVKNRIGTVVYRLKHGALIQTQSNSVILLIEWLLKNSAEDFPPGDDVREVILLLPKKKSFLPHLMVICDELALRSYTKAIDLKAEIKQLFVND